MIDRNRGLHTWKVVCATPFALSGRELLQLEEDDLQCSAETSLRLLPQELTVNSGSKVLFSCAAQGNNAKYINSCI